MVSFLTLKSPFCKYEVAKDQDDTGLNNESDENEKEESKLAAVAESIKEGSQMIKLSYSPYYMVHQRHHM